MSADRSEVRLSDAERQEALDTLGEHLGTGRLDIDEFSDRSARAGAARTRGDLAPLFADLPAPHPSVLRAPSSKAAVQPAPRLSVSERLASSAVPIAAVVAILLYLTVARGFWLVFLLPGIIALLVGSARGGRRRR